MTDPSNANVLQELSDTWRASLSTSEPEAEPQPPPDDGSAQTTAPLPPDSATVELSQDELPSEKPARHVGRTKAPTTPK